VSGKPGTKLDSAGNLRVLKCGMKQFYRNPRWKTLRITPMRLQYLSSRLLHLTTLFQEALSQILMESVSSLMRFGRKQANHQDAQTGTGVTILPFTARKIHFTAIS
jgi:hypothetical protein